MGSRFERIPSGLHDEDASLVNLEEVLRKALPKSVQLYVLCRLARQNRFPEDVDIKFYRYTESEETTEKWCWESGEEPFIICVQKPNFHTKKGIIMLTPKNPTPDMIQAFDSFIGWEASQVFHCVQAPFWSHLQAMCTAHNNQKPENSLGIPGIMLAILDADKAKSLNAENMKKATNNDKLYIRQIEDKDVPEIVNQWKWRAEHSGEVIRKCVKTLVSCGLFLGGAEGKEELVSSVVQSPLGAANILYTPENHRRKGYGKIVMEWIAQEMVTKMGIPPMAEVEIWNDASRKLLEKVGYREVFKTKWFYYDPPSSSQSPSLE